MVSDCQGVSVRGTVLCMGVYVHVVHVSRCECLRCVWMVDVSLSGWVVPVGVYVSMCVWEYEFVCLYVYVSVCDRVSVSG